MAMRGFFLDNGAFEKYRHRISARRMMTILGKASDSTMFPDDPDKGDSLFTPKNPQETEFWKILRDDIKQQARRYLANRENGARGGRPKQQPEPPAQKPAQPPVTPPPAPPKGGSVQDLIGGLAQKLGNKSPYKQLVITDAFDLTKLDGAVGEALRLAYPPNRSDTLARLSRWCIKKKLGQTVDAKWLNDMATKFYIKNRNL